MNYQEMYELLEENHSAHWGGTFQEMTDSDKELAIAKASYPEIYEQAMEDYNNYLRSL